MVVAGWMNRNNEAYQIKVCDQLNIGDYTDCITNGYQYTSDIWLGLKNGNVCFFINSQGISNQTRFKNCLCEICNGSISILHQFDNSIIIRAITDHYLYFSADTNDEANILYSYDFMKDSISLIYEGFQIYGPPQYVGDAVILIGNQSNDMESEILFISENKASVLSANELTEYVSCGENDYFMIHRESGYNWKGGQHDVYVRRGDEGWTKLLLNENNLARTILSTQYGVLIYSYGGGHLLDIVTEDGTVKELFEVPYDVTDGAFTVYEEYVYLSVAKHDTGTLLSEGKNHRKEEFEGFYRIDLTDGRIEKLSDSIYNGLFIIDETGIYACPIMNEGAGVIKLDFYGNALERVLVIEPS